MPRPNLLISILQSHSLIPDSVMRRLARRSLGGLEVYLCLHRVRFTSQPNSNLQDTEISAAELDRLLMLLGCDASDSAAPKVTATFDDGYADAVEYVKTRHATFPNINWMFFVCPTKTRDRVGFRWDLASPELPMDAQFAVALENRRPELQGLADETRCQLATVAQLREVAALPRVSLGNHSNCHFPLAALDAESSAREIRESRRDFQELFGESSLFAFPFGVERMHFGPEHVAVLKSEGYGRLFSVEPRPVQAGVRQPFEVVPRFAVMGTWPSSKTALYISLVALREKLKNLSATTRSKKACQ
jgi:hypothetical protein